MKDKRIESLIKKYPEINFIFGDCESICYRDFMIIFLNDCIEREPTDDHIFTMLHEIGHIKNNNNKMKKCEREFYATVWAIEESHKMNLNISESCKKLYQDYINSFAKKRKTISSSDVTLIW